MKTNVTVNIDTVEYSVEGMDFHIPGTKTARVTNDDGEILDSYQNRMSMPGKFGSHSLQVRTKHSGKQLMIEGSPYAYLHGQNVFTSSNLSKGCIETLRQVCNKFGFKPTIELRKQWMNGDINLERVDIAVNFRMKSEADVVSVTRQIRRQLEEQGGSTRTSGTTIYWVPRDGKEYSISFYAKGPQMRRLKRFDNLPDQDKLLDECETILRVEIRLRASALRMLGLNKVSAWGEGSAQKAFKKYMSRLKLLSVTSGPVNAEELANLPSKLRPVLAAHKAGLDLALIYQKRSLQRHTADFRKLGIDLRCPNQPTGTVIPLTKVLAPKRAIKSAPDWMKEAGLVPADRHLPKVPLTPALIKIPTLSRQLKVIGKQSLNKTKAPTAVGVKRRF